MTLNQTNRRLLLVEDNAADVRLCMEAIKELELPVDLSVAMDGVEAIEFLNNIGPGANPRPDIILLDLNLPRKDGKDVLREIRLNAKFADIPVLVLSTSIANRDIQECYGLHANSFLNKPVDFDSFCLLLTMVKNYWFDLVLFPENEFSF